MSSVSEPLPVAAFTPPRGLPRASVDRQSKGKQLVCQILQLQAQACWSMNLSCHFTWSKYGSKLLRKIASFLK
jgi:hypothetical protein